MCSGMETGTLETLARMRLRLNYAAPEPRTLESPVQPERSQKNPVWNNSAYLKNIRQLEADSVLNGKDENAARLKHSS